MINTPTSGPPKADWEVKTLGEVCEMIKRGIAPKYSEQEGLCVINQKCVRDHLIDFSLSRRHDFEKKKVPEERIVKIGDVLVNSTGVGTLGRVAQIREETEEAATVDTHVTIVRPIPGKFYLDFFGYMLVMIEEKIKTSGEGASGQTELARKTLSEKFHVKYPNSLPEQERIVGILDEAFEGIAAATAQAEKNLHNARELFQSVLQSTFSQKGNDWVETVLGEACELIKRGIAPKYIDEGGLCVINQKCVRDHTVDFRLSRRHNLSIKKVPEERIVRPGDVLVNSTGVGTLGRVAQIREETQEAATVDTHVTIVRPIKGKFYLDFFGYMMVIIEKEIAASGEGSSGQTELSRKALNENFIVRYPESHTTQQAIVEKLDALSEETKRLEAIYERKKAALTELKQSLLQKAFAGEL